MLLVEDGTELPADEIIFATGYTSMLETTQMILSADFASRLKEGGGLSVWRCSGHPGFWFASGNLALCRYLLQNAGSVNKGNRGRYHAL